MKKPFIDDEKVKELLYQYKLGEGKNTLSKSQQNEVLVNLYNLMEPLLKWTITGNITKIYSPKMRKQKYSKLYNLQKSFSSNINMNKFKINFSVACEKYLKDYIDQFGYWDSNNPWNYSLIYPFWEVVERISLEKLEKSIGQYNNEYSYYLAIKFCDDYWNYICRCLRKDLALQILSIDKIKHECNSSVSPNYFDRFLFSNHIYNSTNEIQSTETLLSDIKSLLTCREWELWGLFIQGYTHAEIAAKLNITTEYSRQLKTRIFKKLRTHLPSKYNTK
ncbi:helix-turn-helix transcriptional regulator [Xylanivirga thermophila]|uniref:helix-turn-helix transcriptional regulator n=1 Tax=Xylanivirga thermophila TaxID=2496273 RepID=UPI0013ECE932|nr:sigma factor-like helix-turn-helix DNA-binding protein [Xylanivirga thermophila]